MKCTFYSLLLYIISARGPECEYILTYTIYPNNDTNYHGKQDHGSEKAVKQAKRFEKG
jgi:hypothetical protein